MTFDEYLTEQCLSAMADHHFTKASKHAQGTLHFHKHNARGHAVMSQHYDKKGDAQKAAEHHKKSEEHIAAAQKIEDKQ